MNRVGRITKRVIRAVPSVSPCVSLRSGLNSQSESLSSRLLPRLSMRSINTRSMDSITLGAEKYLAPYYADIIKVSPIDAQGLLIKTTEGKFFFDFNAGYGANRFGHQYVPVLDAAIKQLKTLTLPSRAFYSDLLVQLGQQYSEIYHDILADTLLPSVDVRHDVPQCGFKLGGGDAIDAAIKLGLQWGFKHKKIVDGQQVILMWSGKDLFHGRMVSNLPPYLADQPTTMSQGFAQLGKQENGFIIGGSPTKILVRFNDQLALTNAFKQYGERICVAMGEYVLGEGGVQPADPEFLQTIRSLCTQYQALMLADDVQTFAATGHYSPSQHAHFADHHVKPDVIVVSKAVTAGVAPGSIILARQSIWRNIPEGSDGSTYAGNPVFCAVALATLQAIKQHNLLGEIERAGTVIENGLRQCLLSRRSIISRNCLAWEKKCSCNWLGMRLKVHW